MATSARPDVSVNQQVVAESPTVLQSTLTACMVGPCFAIASPLDEDGALESSMVLSTPASTTGTVTLGAVAAVASTFLGITVDTNSIVVMEFPAVASGSNLAQELITQTIKSKFKGSLGAKMQDNKLVLTSKTSGDNSKIRVHSQADLLANGHITGAQTAANTLLGLDGVEDTDIFGNGSYKNLSMTAPYDMFPTLSYHPGADELVFDKTEMDLYRLFSGKLNKFSKDSAINWNANISSGATKIMNSAVTFGAPHTVIKTDLVSLNGVGSKTSRVFNPGQDASVVIPLSATNANLTTNWPDGSGTHFIRAEANGLQAFKLNQSVNCGAFAGAAGNDVYILFEEGNPVAIEVASPQIKIKFEENGTTYTQLKNTIEAAAAAWGPLLSTFEVIFPTTDGDDKIDPHAGATKLDAHEYFLSGGQDPIDFSQAGANDAAVIIGSMVVDGGVDPVSLVSGKNLTFSINGADPITVAVPTQTPTAAQLKTDIEAATTITVDIAETIKSRYDHHASGDVIKLTAPGADGHFSTLELGGDPEAIEMLFSGFLTKTEQLSDGAPVGGAIEGSLTTGSGNDKFNATANNELEKAIKESSVTLQLDGLTALAHTISSGGDTSMPPKNVAYTVKLKHSEFTPTNGSQGSVFTITYTPVVDGAGAVADHVAKINTALAATGENDDATTFVAAEEIALNDSSSTGHLVFRTADSTAGATLELVTTGTTAAWKTAYNGSGAAAVAAFDVPFANQACSVTITDDPGATLPAKASVSVSGNFSQPPNWSYLSDDGAKVTEVDYSIGAFAYNMQSTLFTSGASYTRTLTYTRGAANHVDIAKKDYTSSIWSGQSSKILSGDKLWNKGVVVATIVKTENTNITGAPSGWGAGATLVLSAEAVDNDTTLTKWYATAENLPESGGRTSPEAVFDDVLQQVTLKHALNRGPDGIPVTGKATMYAEYKALRLDVSPKATTPGILVFNSATEVADQIGPISADNPLAMSLYLGFLNSPTSQLFALGVGETSENAPDGTVEGYEAALDLLEKFDVYGIAPLTHDLSVHQLLSTHVSELSNSGKKERIAMVCPKLPTEESSTLITTGTGVTVAKQSAGVWNFVFDETVNIPSLLDGAKDANGATINVGVGTIFTANQGVYLTRTGDPFRYLVTQVVSANTVQVKTSAQAYDEDAGPGTGGNDDAYYMDKDTKLDDFPATGETVTMQVRQAKIDATTNAGKLKQMEALSSMASSYLNRRLFLIEPENIGTTLDGLEVIVPGYYAATSVAAMVGQYSVATPFTNLPMNGFTRPSGSSDRFTEQQMATAAAGGVYWIIQDTIGQPLFSRHQLSTDMSNTKTKELSVVKSVDLVAKKLRAVLRPKIGRNNITKGLITELTLLINGVLKRSAGTDVADAKLRTLGVVDNTLDELAVTVDITPYYPANKITVTIVI